MVDGQYVPGLTATGKNKQECSERLILAWSRRMAQDAHIAALKAENQPTEDKPVVEGMIEPIEPTQQNDIIEISEEGKEYFYLEFYEGQKLEFWAKNMDVKQE